MVIKVKVSDVAKDFGKSNKEIIELLDKYCGGPAKKASTVLEENELNILFDKITIQNSVKSFDAYFKSGAAKAKKEKPAAQKQDKPAKKAETAKDKKRESQAAILQMAEQAAKRAEEKAKKKSRGSAPGPHKGRGSPYRHSR
ncbi:MAG: translation initiation factor IF-2 N-terminal domain-containing protein [Anaerotruncus sp.]|nr:MAG: translation initiation factor IF-2 N-terminal domain-containing protein [Anaerotruncus sp.]